MKTIITLVLVAASLLARAQTIEMLLIGDSKSKASRIVKEMASIDSDFIFEEYNGWYDGINDYVNQYTIWGGGMLLKTVFVIEGKVSMQVTFSSEPPANTSQKRLDEIQKLLRSKNGPPDITYLSDNTYKVFINNEFYCYRKHLIFYSPEKPGIQPYIIDADNFDALQRHTALWVSLIKDNLRYRYL